MLYLSTEVFDLEKWSFDRRKREPTWTLRNGGLYAMWGSPLVDHNGSVNIKQHKRNITLGWRHDASPLIFYRSRKWRLYCLTMQTCSKVSLVIGYLRRECYFRGNNVEALGMITWSLPLKDTSGSCLNRERGRSQGLQDMLAFIISLGFFLI